MIIWLSADHTAPPIKPIDLNSLLLPVGETLAATVTSLSALPLRNELGKEPELYQNRTAIDAQSLAGNVAGSAI